jgi:hypothetical protein
VHGKKGFSLCPRNATEKSGVQGSWPFWLSVITNIAGTMKMATIILTSLDGNMLIDHESLDSLQLTHN